MYIYKMEEITDTNKNDIQKLYDDHYPEKTDEVRENIESGSNKYCIGVENNNQLVGVMGIRETYPDSNFSWNVNNQPTSPTGYYIYSYLVVHINHRNQGLAKGILRVAMKLLIDIGAKKLRIHRNPNDKYAIPPIVITDVGFEFVAYNEENECPEVYDFDVAKADMNKLEEVWSEYNVE